MMIAEEPTPLDHLPDEKDRIAATAVGHSLEDLRRLLVRASLHRRQQPDFVGVRRPRREHR